MKLVSLKEVGPKWSRSRCSRGFTLATFDDGSTEEFRGKSLDEILKELKQRGITWKTYHS